MSTSRRFGPFVLDPQERRLTRDGAIVSVQDQVLSLLDLLLSRPGQLWTREALHEALWPDTIVGEDALFQVVRKARKALGDSARRPAWIATVPGRGYRFVGAVLGQATTPQPAAPTSLSVFPRRQDRFVGRAALLDRLAAAVEGGAGQWTLTGPGGVGKTRLSLELCARCALPGGVVFCDLQSCAGEASVWEALGRALRLTSRGADAIEALQRRGPCLLVLDNGEQVARPLATVAQRLRDGAPRARLVVTSRLRLGNRGEQLVAVPPLSVPDADLATAMASPAARLLLVRAQQAAGWAPAPGDDAALVALLRALGGLPLAIELAAPRLRLLSPGQLLSRMDRQLDLLRSRDPGRPDRHTTLRSTIAASWELLEPPEQDALARLGSLAGAFSVETAEAVLDGGLADPVLSLAELLDHSLVQRSDRGRLSMLPSIRGFARDHCGPAVRAAVLERAVSWFAARAGEEVDPDERDNLVQALSHARQGGDAARAAAIARSLGRLLLIQGPLRAVSDHLSPVRGLAGVSGRDRAALLLLEAEAGMRSSSVEPAGLLLDEVTGLIGEGDPLQGRLALLRAGWHYRRGDARAAATAATAGLALPNLDAESRARLLIQRSQIAFFVGARAESLSLLQAARPLVEGLGPALHALLLYELGNTQIALDDYAAGQESLAESLTTARRGDNPSAIGRAQALLGRALAYQGAHAQAKALLDAAEPILRQSGAAQELGTLLDSRAQLAGKEGRLEDAIGLFHQAIAYLETTGQDRMLSATRFSMVAALSRVGRLDEAHAQMQGLLQLHRRQGRNVGPILHNLGHFDMLRGNWDAARGYLQEARALFGEQGVQLGLVWVTLGEVELGAGNLDVAQSHLTTALEVLRARRSRGFVALALGFRGLVYARRGAWARSEADHAEAADLAAGMRSQDLLGQIQACRLLSLLHAGDVVAARALRTQMQSSLSAEILGLSEVRVLLQQAEDALCAAAAHLGQA